MDSIKNNQSENGNNRVFFIISVLSWLLFLVTAWLSIGLPYSFNFKFFWLTFSFDYEIGSYYPLVMHFVFHYIIFIFTFAISTLAFLIYMTYRDDNNVTDGMLGKYSKFHFIPLLCISALFIIGESVDEFKGRLNTVMFIFDFIFTLIGLASLIFIRVQTKIESPWYAIFAIKEGTYSCLIALLIYNVGFNFTYYGLYEMNDKKYIENWKTGCGIAFPIIIGVANVVLSIIFQDCMIAIMNILIYVGMIINFYNTDTDIRNEFNATGEGIIDIIILSLSACSILFFILRHKSIICTS
jgi:hypothetical protein